MEGTTATADSTTPVTTTTATPSGDAAATVQPSQSVAPSERPRTLQEAFARDAAATSPAPAAASESPTTPAAETSETPAVSPETPKGPIPFDVHKTALENARTKAAADLQAQFDTEYGWAKQIPREQIQAWAGMAQEMTANPIAFLEKFSAELHAHPTYGPQLRSAAARTLASRQPAESGPPPADVAITDANGQVVGRTYSAEGLAKRDEWLIHRVIAQMQGEIAPVKQHVEAQQRAVQQAAAQRQAIESSADAVIAEIHDLVEGNADAIKATAKAMAEHPDWSPRKAALYARDEVLVMPKATAKAMPQVVSDLKTKAAASTVNPAGTAVTTPRRPTSLLDPTLSWS